VNIVDVKWWEMDCIDLAEDRILFHVLVTSSEYAGLLYKAKFS
jgi:hypothetical protein